MPTLLFVASTTKTSVSNVMSPVMFVSRLSVTSPEVPPPFKFVPATTLSMSPELAANDANLTASASDKRPPVVAVMFLITERGEPPNLAPSTFDGGRILDMG